MKLTSHEFRVLSYLMHQRGRVVSQAELTEHIYAQSADRDSNTVEVFIARLRRKLGGTYIETVRGLGYRIEAREMTPAASFRRRLILGSVLWIVGLLAITTVIGVTIVHRYPHMVGFVHNSALVVFATICLLGGLSVVRHGLSPFTDLRERLAAVREGRDRRLEGRYPSEVQPLVDDLNALLDHRDQTVRRAIAKAGDLAHALKTPLAVLAHEAEVADAAGPAELAAVMRQQVERMRRQMDYHLAHARAAASGAAPGTRCAVLDSAEGLARTLLRLHAERGLAIQVHVDPAHTVRGAARGSRRDARQPARQRLQVGAIADRDRVREPTARPS